MKSFRNLKKMSLDEINTTFLISLGFSNVVNGFSVYQLMTMLIVISDLKFLSFLLPLPWYLFNLPGDNDMWVVTSSEI